MDVELDINWDKIDRAANEMISSFGADALGEAEKRAEAMRVHGQLAAAATWDSICKQIKARGRL